MKEKKLVMKVVIILIIILALVGIGFLAKNYFFKQGDSVAGIKLDTIFLKVQVEEGGSSVNNINIKNEDNIQNQFSVKTEGLQNLISIEKTEFNLEPGSNEDVKINFNTQGFSAGVYLGEIIISSSKGIERVPVILEVQSKEVLFHPKVTIYPQGQAVVPGQKLNAEIKIFDVTSVGRSNIELSYFVKGFDDKTVKFELEELIIEGDQETLTKQIDISGDTAPGNYVLAVAIKYGDSIGTSTEFFNIVSPTTKEDGEFKLTITHLIIILSFFFLAFTALFLYTIFSRDKLLREMQGQYQRAIRKQNELIRHQGKENLKKLKGKERIVYKKELEKVKKQRIKALKSMHKKRIIEYKKIKKTKNKNKMNIQLNKWRKQGYDTSILEKRYKVPNVESIQAQINKWKKRGYNTGVLDKHLKK